MEMLRKFVKWVTRHRVLSIGVAVVLLGLVGSIRVLLTRTDGVLSEPLRRGPVVDAVYGIGTVTAARSYSIKPGIITTIRNLYIKEGDFVHKGGKLVDVDNVIYTAPFDGTVNFLPFKVGENIFTQLPAVVLTDLTNRYLVVSLEQQGALRVRAGQKAKLNFDSIRQQNFDGVVESVYSYNGNFLARIDVSNLPAEILPDMTADVAIIVRKLEDVLLIPVSALESDSVWVKRGHMIPTKVPVKIGIVDASMAEVTSGNLQVGDQVMVRRKVSP